MKKVSFFSYKGGAGRSTLALNMIPILASREFLDATAEHPVIILDMDVDSAGMTYLLGKQREVANDICYVVQDIFGENCDTDLLTNSTNAPITSHRLFSNLCKVGRFFGLSEDAAVLFMPAKSGRAIGKNGNYDADGKNASLDKFLKLCESYKCTGVIFDSPAGEQLTAKWSNKVSDIILCCMRPTFQFQEGTFRFLNQYLKNVRDKNLILVPNVVPSSSLVIDDRIYPDYAIASIRENANSLASNFRSNKVYTDLLSGDVFGIPKVERFMWQESILRLVSESNLNEDEKIALRVYYRIAKLIQGIDCEESW